MTYGVFIVILWIAAGIFTLVDAFLNNKGEVNSLNYIICWGALLFCLFCDYILKV